MAGAQAFVYRICPEDEWAAAQAAGALRGGQLDTTSGYIHLSTAVQVDHSPLRSLLCARIRAEDFRWSRLLLVEDMYMQDLNEQYRYDWLCSIVGVYVFWAIFDEVVSSEIGDYSSEWLMWDIPLYFRLLNFCEFDYVKEMHSLTSMCRWQGRLHCFMLDGVTYTYSKWKLLRSLLLSLTLDSLW